MFVLCEYRYPPSITRQPWNVTVCNVVLFMFCVDFHSIQTSTLSESLWWNTIWNKHLHIPASSYHFPMLFLFMPTTKFCCDNRRRLCLLTAYRISYSPSFWSWIDGFTEPGFPFGSAHGNRMLCHWGSEWLSLLSCLFWELGKASKAHSWSCSERVMFPSNFVHRCLDVTCHFFWQETNAVTGSQFSLCWWWMHHYFDQKYTINKNLMSVILVPVPDVWSELSQKSACRNSGYQFHRL